MTRVSASATADEAGQTTVEALVLRTEAGFSQVRTDAGTNLVVKLAKKAKAGERISTTRVVIGDRVCVRPGSNGEGTVESVIERRNELARLAPGHRRRTDVLAANLDTLIIVHSLRRPDFNPARMDRFLAIAEQAEIPATIVLNKADLASSEERESVSAIYEKAGYPVILTSATTRMGIAEVEIGLRGLCALIGPSGVGKSSIINRIRPDLHLRTADVSEATGKGTHTTVTSELLELSPGNYVADTPGLRSIVLADIDKYEVAGLFKEFQPLIGLCRFPDCLHREEPGCAVRAQVEEGLIASSRYDGYLRLLDAVTEGYLQDWET